MHIIDIDGFDYHFWGTFGACNNSGNTKFISYSIFFIFNQIQLNFNSLFLLGIAIGNGGGRKKQNWKSLLLCRLWSLLKTCIKYVKN